MEDAQVCLHTECIDYNDDSVGRVRQVKELSNNNRGAIRGIWIRNASEELDTTTEAAGDR